jgi:hypothetical protein
MATFVLSARQGPLKSVNWGAGSPALSIALPRDGIGIMTITALSNATGRAEHPKMHRSRLGQRLLGVAEVKF